MMGLKKSIKFCKQHPILEKEVKRLERILDKKRKRRKKNE
jgi:hypothetical protein